MRIGIFCVVVSLVGCASSERRTAATTPEATRPSTPSGRAGEHGDAIPHVETARSGDLEVRVVAPERVAAIEEPSTVPITIEVTNATDRWISVHPAHARVEVFEGTELVEGCASDVRLDLPLFLEPGQTLASESTLPCALPDGGEYSIVASVVIGERDARAMSPTDTLSAASARLIVEALPPESMPIARAPSPAVHAFPPRANADPIGGEDVAFD